MPTAIIIGFEYSVNKLSYVQSSLSTSSFASHGNHGKLASPTTLPGAFIDIYQAHRWCLSFNCAAYILTDVTGDVSSKYSFVLKKSIANNIVDPDIVSFYDMVDTTLVNTSAELLLGLDAILLNMSDNRLIIYYTGHGNKDALVMPSHELLSFITFRDRILSKIPTTTEVFWILDCCNPTGLHLPFLLDHNNFVLSSAKISCVLQPILLIISSNSEEKSVTSDMGSLFSRELFRLLHTLNSGNTTFSGRNRNMRRLLGNLSSAIRKMHTGYTQTLSIYSSYIIDPVLWLWIGSTDTNDVVADMSLSTIIIR